jgi:hypothetical protein
LLRHAAPPRKGHQRSRRGYCDLSRASCSQLPTYIARSQIARFAHWAFLGSSAIVSIHYTTLPAHKHIHHFLSVFIFHFLYLLTVFPSLRHAAPPRSGQQRSRRGLLTFSASIKRRGDLNPA